MYTIEFYEDSRGNSAIWQFLETLRIKALTNKDARIQYKQISLCLNLLEEKGTYLPETITKYIADGIWELRPGNNRILYFFTQITALFYCITLEKRLKSCPKKSLSRL